MSLETTQNSLINIKRLMSQGEFDIAHFECVKCLLENPLDVETQLIMSGLYYRSGKYQSAVHYALQAEKLLSEASGWQEVLATSSQLMHFGEEQAAVNCMKFISIHLVKNVPGATDIGKHYQQLEDHERALAWLSVAENHGLNLAQVAELRGRIHMFDGDLSSSEKELEKSIVVHKNCSVSPHLLLSMFGNANARIERLKKLSTGNQFPPQDLPYLNYALFKELDSVDQIDAAWEYLLKAAALTRKEVFYSSDLESAAYDELIAATKNLEIGDNSNSNEITTPIFIVGMPRSGTSLLESMLASDSSIAACGELKLMRSQIQFVLNQKMGTPFDREALKAIPELDFARLGQRYLEKAGWKAKGKPFLIDKNPGNFNYAGLILRAMPHAKIINLVRNPMDVCFSNLKEIFGPNYYTYSYTQEECANHYRNYRRLMTHWHQIAPGKILDVAYENLVSQPVLELERVQKFCGLEYRPYQQKQPKAEFMSNSASTVQIREPIHTRNLNGWQRYKQYLVALEELLKSESADYEKTYLA